ncbi:MAG: IS66 family transposase [Candidatus Rokubacteria bacterium]|nr:IS66 family transposase [Candidatus Rokubacteria bacterium]
MLRQVAVLLERENDKLHAKLQTLTAELVRLRGAARPAAELELEFLKELLAQREQALFGASSEQRPRPATSTPSPPPAARPGHGPTAQPALPTLDVVHELDAADLTCPQCGGMLREMPGQTEDADEITVIERQFVLLKHRRKKYRCTCNGCVDTAPGPLRLAARPDVRGRRYSPSFAVEVAVGKYLDHLPLERQARVMAREGLTIESQTLWDQIEALAAVLQPTYDALRRYVLTAPVVGADETWWRLLGGPENKRWWAWSVTRDDAVTYTILESRSQEAARRVLDGYHGIVLADGYGAYDALARAGPGFMLAHCWAHVRRKFVEAEPHYPAPCAEILELIGQLYAVERAGPGVDPAASDETRAAALDLRARLRRERSTPIVEAIRAWAYQQRALPESSLGKAIAYLLGLWPGLTRCLDDPRIPLDNNATERGLRGMVVGRKNHYGSRSKRGTEVAALFYSLIESAKLCGVEPKAYLLHATHAALENPGTVTLPHALLTA